MGPTRIGILVLAVLGVTSSDAQSTCCAKGNDLGNIVFKQPLYSSCSIDDTRSALTEKERGNFMCKFEFENCCKIRANTQFCEVGTSLARSGQNCGANSGTGSAKRSCCQCCKDGQAAGLKEESCDRQITQATSLLTGLCTLSFKSCCEDAKKKKTQDSIQKLKCSQLKCGENTDGCKETATGAECQCKRGYKKETSISCVDINECFSTKLNRCPKNAYCMNTEGSYKCLLNCPSPNYQVVVLDKVCADVDECAKGTHRCQANKQKCVNHEGGYKCIQVACDDGLKLVNNVCIDIDECKETPNICGRGKCQNIYSSYFCYCERGFKFDKTCVDLNECESNRHYCDFECVNKEGSYHCNCPKGYQVVGTRCVDNNECANSTNPCAKGSYCFNTPGSYMCINQTCPDIGYYIQEPERREPDKCKKECNLASEEKKKECEEGITPQSIKRVTYKYTKAIRIGGFVYNYWWAFSASSFIVEPRIVKGNDDGDFTIQRVSKNQVKIINTQRIEGPKNYHFIMHNDVRRRVQGEPISYRYVYHFYVYVSEHSF